MQLFDVCTKRVYEVDGEKKVKWYRAGFMKTTERGSTYIRLFNQPDVDLYVFKKDMDLPVVQAEE
jgi:hypothetical protein